MAGVFQSTDGNTQVVCQDDNPPPSAGAACPGTPAAFQYVEHSLAGTRNGTRNGVTFEFDWTPDADLTGDLTFYIAANAANGDGDRTGDHTYYLNYTLKQVVAGGPQISANGVVDGASFTADLAPDTWMTISGTNLSDTTRTWTATDFVNGQPPTELDGVSVSVNGEAAYVYYISPVQVNVLVPADVAVGAATVVLTKHGTASQPSTITLAVAAPEVFLIDGTHAAAEHADGSLVTSASPAHPGEIVALFVTGLGAFPAGTTVTVSGVNATVSYAGPVSGALGLGQVNVQIPIDTPAGDAPVVLQTSGITAQGKVMLPCGS